ncbi:MAG: transglycosylase domain-containing protein [Deltaproteobacteria bacterium]|jgi:penicillin-binding protein 1C|nr:transglycosylase domain-containing protein [Deltaproteobacteria bacterium]
MAEVGKKVKKITLRGLARVAAKTAIGLGLFGVIFLAVGFILATPPRYDGFAVSPVLLGADGEPLYVGISADQELAIPLSLDRMGEIFPRIAVAVEDKRFFSHPGVDPLALARAAFQNIKNRRVISGASTITVQLVRLSQPRPRNLWSKMVEFFQALRLERELGKDEILTVYLNRAPFGGNVRGVGAAAAIYFGKSPADLTLGESAVLVALLRGPSIYRPDRWPGRAKVRRDMVLSILRGKGAISEGDERRARLEPVTGKRFSPPRKAPHLAAYLLDPAESPRWRWGAEGYAGVPTSVDPALQENLEKRLLVALGPFPGEVNGAGILVSNRTGRVLAYVGGVRREGPTFHVDNARSRRSPGSTLKPFVYLAAFADGKLGPSSLLADSPLGLGGDAPRNFDGEYRGPVAAGVALSESLNVPAVRVLRLIGEERALEVLREAGFTVPEGRAFGDSLVLGGMETSMLELAGAYATLARGGEAVRPGFDPGGHYLGPRIFSGEAVWLINESLLSPRLLGPGLSGESLAIKSGTSISLRDAWLAAYDPAHTLVLWLGDPSGRSHKGLTGLASLSAAGVQFMHDLGPRPLWPDPPDGLERFRACPVSGEPASPFCPGSRWAWRIKSLAKSHPCRLHLRRNGQTVTAWPPELSRLTRGPGHFPVRPGPGPQVVSPKPGAQVVMDGQNPHLQLKSEGAVGLVHWYLDDRFVGTADKRATITIEPGPGPHKVSLMDSLNMTARSEFTVVEKDSPKVADKDTPLPIID